MTQKKMTQKKMTQYRSEQRFLADQAADATTAMMQTVQEMKQTLAKATDVRTCARQHPWIATGSAVAAGFVAGAVLSSPRSTSGERIPAKTDAAAPPDSTGHNPARVKTGLLLATLGTVLPGVVQTLLQGFIAAAVVAPEVDHVKEEPKPDLQPEPNAFAADARPAGTDEERKMSHGNP